MFFFLLYIILSAGIKAEYSDSAFDGTIILGRPENTSITANITSNKESQVYLQWGEKSKTYTGKSNTEEASNLKPAVIKMDGLKGDKEYYYRLFFKDSKTDEFKNTQEYSFRTPRIAGEKYTFVVQSDSHLSNRGDNKNKPDKGNKESKSGNKGKGSSKADKEIYTKSMETMAGYKPDFIFDMGDTFLNDQVENAQYQNYETIRETSFAQRAFFDLVTRSAPLFLTIGNHEGEYGYFLDGTDKNLTVMSTLIRKTYYPNPVPDEFYSGNRESENFVGQPENYYAFQWGDALYVSIDPYRYLTSEDDKGWNWTMGKTQYDWFRKTLEESKAKYKFVFAHHALGKIRGGAIVANLFEWGGYDRNGRYLFDRERPGWGKPVQQIMKDTGVTIFFQGHDHLFARENVDGVVYQTLPKPAEKFPDKKSNFNSYPDCDKLLNSGFLKVDVTPEYVQVDYYRNYFVSTGSQEGNTGIVYSYTVDTGHNVKVLKSVKDDLNTYGSGGENNDTGKPGKKKKDGEGKKSKEDRKIRGKKDSNTEYLPWEKINGIIQGAPSDTSIKIKAIAGSDMDTYFEYGTSEDNLSQKTPLKSYKKGEIIEVTLKNLLSDREYYYRMLTGKRGSSDYTPLQTGRFHTCRERGETFIFTVQSDSHRDEKTDIALYENTLKNILNDSPDFHIDLGDTFMGEKLGITEEGTIERYLEDRGYFSKIANSVPLFLVNGNHEGECGWERGKNSDNIALWACRARLKYFPNPEPGGFYRGSNPGEGNYYSFTWGDALFIMLDPFWFSMQKARGDDDGWNYTLGKTQYDWLKITLEQSSAKYKFVFIHNLAGGYGKDARGGSEAVKFFEWGGYNSDGTYGFDKMRPSWGKPVHQLLVQNKVRAVFHGHDHFYAKQKLDGIIYQLVPQPGHPGKEVRHAEEYGYKEGVILPPAGHMRITVSGETVKVEYIKSSLQKNINGTVADSYTINL